MLHHGDIPRLQWSAVDRWIPPESTAIHLQLWNQWNSTGGTIEVVSIVILLDLLVTVALTLHCQPAPPSHLKGLTWKCHPLQASSAQ
jgi:hypothetical protein